MAIKKSELYSSLWKSCDELRGGMDELEAKVNKHLGKMGFAF
jgi:type I restriction enzyme M protein